MQKFKLSFVIIASLATLQLAGQTKYDVELFSYGGREYTIFKGPEKLLDAQNQYYNTNDIIISDYFLESGISTKYELKKKKKYVFELGGDFQYRKYFNNPQIDEKGMVLNTVFEKYISKKLNIGIGYEFSWKDKIGVSVLGDELTRSFKYYSNQGFIYIDYRPNKKLDFVLDGSYELKSYYKDSTVMSLNHANVDVIFETKYEFNKKNAITLNIGYRNRQYENYLASDVNGNLAANTVRHFRYFAADINYDWEPLKGFLIGPGFQYKIRDDFFEEYYNYTQYSPFIKLRYMSKKFYAYFKTSYRSVNYVNKYAYTVIPNEKQLEYSYLDFNFKIKYKVLKRVEIFANYNSTDRNSNTELENKRTRREYNNNEILLGLNFIISDYNSKYDKKK